MAKLIIDNATTILMKLAQEPRDKSGFVEMTGHDLSEKTGLSPSDINDAVIMLEESGYIERLRISGTAPFLFHSISLTSRGKYEYERLVTESSTVSNKRGNISTPIQPVGSPYGFTDQDWEHVVEIKAKPDVLRVVFGYQFESKYYNTTLLKNNIKKMFERTIKNYKKSPTALPVILDFLCLSAGYGEHLFNKIARDIISADIAVFDTSDLNPNVMIEMGVALTWGIRVLPIKNVTCPKPPSDISGQTFADYKESAQNFIREDHEEELLRMIERAIRKRGLTIHTES
jgi:DNA-binding MarR family transcriptional regulator